MGTSHPSPGVVTFVLICLSDGTVAAGPVFLGNVTFGNFTINQAFSAHPVHYSMLEISNFPKYLLLGQMQRLMATKGYSELGRMSCYFLLKI